MRSLEELTSSLQSSSIDLRLSDESVVALETNPAAPDGYVWPNLSSWSEQEGARVILIEAAGAVGKTAAASAVAERLNWPLVNAAKAQVGSYSLTGLLHDALGLDSPFLGDVVNGRSGVIIDALDEAHLRAGTANFQAFLQNVNKLAEPRNGAPANIVLFSRPDTADLVRTSFDEFQAPISSASIDFLSYNQACGFVDSYMNRKAKDSSKRSNRYKASQQNPEEFKHLRNSKLAEIASILLASKVDSAEEHWDSVRNFLGYAPVLSVICEYLAVGNPYAEIQRSDSGVASTGVVLREIIDYLLDREQEKFFTQVGDKLVAELSPLEEWPQRELAYSPSEQVVRLVARRYGLALSVNPPATLPDSIRQSYESHAGQFIADHPFLVDREPINVVFADFISAKAAVDLDCLRHIRQVPSKRVDEVGPFFYQFVHEFAPRESEGYPTVDENLVQRIFGSHNQSIDARKHGPILYVQSQEHAQISVPGDAGGQAVDRIDYEVVNLSGLLEIDEQLSRALVISDAAIRLSAKDAFLMGPMCTVFCKELIVDAPIISVAPTRGNSTDASLLLVDNIQVDSNLTVDCKDPKAFRIISDSVYPAFVRYRVGRRTSEEMAFEGGYVDLLGIIRVFKRSTQHGPSVFADKLDKRVIGANATKQKMLKGLMALKIVIRDGSHYRLDLAKLTSHGLALPDITGGHPSGAVLSFIQKLMGS